MFVVLGAHRSGTSAVCGALAELGLDVGSPLLAANDANPTGYYELEPLVEFHEQLLRSLNHPWDDPRPFDFASLAPATREAAKRQAGALLDRTFSDTASAVIKDPRQCRLLEIWQSTLSAQDPRFVLVHRPAVEVAGSMAKQWGTSPHRAGLLWLVHILDAEAATRGQRRALLSYDQLLRHPVATLELLGRALDTPWPIAPSRAADALGNYLQPKLRHHRTNQPDFGDLAPIITQLEAALERGSDDDTFVAAVDRCRQRCSTVLDQLDSPAFEHANSLSYRNADGLGDLERRIEEQSAWLKTISGQIEDLEANRATHSSAAVSSEAAVATGEPSHLDKLAFKVDDAASKTAKFEMRLRELATRKEVRQLAGKVDMLMKSVANGSDASAGGTGSGNGSGNGAAAASAADKAADRNDGTGDTQAPKKVRAFAKSGGAGPGAGKGSDRQNGGSVGPGSSTSGRSGRAIKSGADHVQAPTNGAGGSGGAKNPPSVPIKVAQRLQQQVQTLRDRVESLEADSRVAANRTAAAGSSADLQQELDEAHRLLGEHQKWLQQLAKDVRGLRAVNEEQQRWLKQISNDTGQNAGHIVRIQREITPTDSPPIVRRVAARTVRAQREQVKRWRVNRMRDLAPANPTIGQETMGRLLAGTQPQEPTTPLRDLRFDPVEAPLLSIVVAAYNQFDLTARSLASIYENPASVPFEIILADDASTDPNMARFADVDGLSVVRSENNQGFLQTVNDAAAHARGDYLLLLNNDAFVTPGCLDAMLGTFAEQRNVAIVGAKLLNPSGSVQEAGGIVWADGSAWNYGRGLHPEEPVLNYTRAVDYVSGAALMIVRDIWESLSGFDTAYSPAYYEDTDLCMRVRELDMQVMYQSAATVVHNEGSSYGTDEKFDGKRYQTINQATFLDRWRNSLSTHRANGDAPEFEKERSVAHRTLVIDARMLYPNRDSGSLRMQRILRALANAGSKVTFLPHNLRMEEPYGTELRATGVEVWGAPFVASVEEYLAERGHLYDLVVLSRVEVAGARLDQVRQFCPGATVVFDTVDLHHLRLEREISVRGSHSGDIDIAEITGAELGAINAADMTWVCSPVERDLLAERAANAQVEVVSNIHDEALTETLPEHRSDLLFVGGFEHPPNVDGIRWFVDEVFPAIRAEAPSTVLHIVGSSTTEEIVDLEQPGIVVHGHVEDLRSLYERCRVVIAPLRYGAGVKGKVTQAMALGVPVVATSVAAEGLGADDEEHLLVADSADLFAVRVLRLLSEDDLWDWLRTCGRKLIEEDFGPEAALGTLESVVAASLRQ